MRLICNIILSYNAQQIETPTVEAAMYICICHAITDKDVRHAESKGANSEDQVFDHFGVEPQCGRCLDTMRCMMNCGRHADEPCVRQAFSQTALSQTALAAE